MSKIDLSKLDDTTGILLSKKSISAIKEIKLKLRKTAETIIEIGDLLVESIGDKDKAYRDEFYKQLGMSERSAQRYMQIAKSDVIKNLKQEEPKLLEKMTLTDLESKIREDNTKKSDANSDEKPKIEASKRAENIYKKYKNDPETLEEIITNLQDMLKKQQNGNNAIPNQ